MPRLWFVPVSLFLLACNGITEPPVTLTGTWIGYRGGSMSLRLTQQGQTVSGDCVWAPDNWAIQPLDTLTLAGSYARPDVALDINFTLSHAVMHFTGRAVGDSLVGSDDWGDRLTFRRQ